MTIILYISSFLILCFLVVLYIVWQSYNLNWFKKVLRILKIDIAEGDVRLKRVVRIGKQNNN